MDLKLRDYQEEVLKIIDNLKPRKLLNSNGNMTSEKQQHLQI